MLLPEARVTVLLIVPAPLAENPDAPVVPVAVKVSARIAEGNTSEILTPVAVLGPVLLRMIVYVIIPPAATEPVAPEMLEPPRLSTFVINRFAVGTSVSVSVDVLLPRMFSVVVVGAVIVAALLSGPGAVALR